MNRSFSPFHGDGHAIGGDHLGQPVPYDPRQHQHVEIQEVNVQRGQQMAMPPPVITNPFVPGQGDQQAFAKN